MLLIINTTTQDYLEIILVGDRGEFKVKKIIGRYSQAEKLMPAIDKFLQAQKSPINQLSGLGVVTGPGGFTAVRIGVAVANALAWSLNLPLVGIRADEFSNNDDLVAKISDRINGLPRSKLVIPAYDLEPNITILNR